MRIRDRYKPAVPKQVLLLLSGLVWGGVGVALLMLAATWLADLSFAVGCELFLVGVGLAIIIYRYALSRIVKRNLSRILPHTERRCLFSFMPWRSYLMIPLMVLMGSLLRHSAIPKPYLAPLYVGMGVALLAAGVRYFHALVLDFKRSGPTEMDSEGARH